MTMRNWNNRILSVLLATATVFSSASTGFAQSLETESADAFASGTGSVAETALTEDGAIHVDADSGSVNVDADSSIQVEPVSDAKTGLMFDTEGGYIAVSKTGGSVFSQDAVLTAKPATQSSDAFASVMGCFTSLLPDGGIDMEEADDYTDVLLRHALSVTDGTSAEANVSVEWQIADESLVQIVSAGGSVPVICSSGVDEVYLAENVSAEVVTVDDAVESDGIAVEGADEQAVKLTFNAVIPATFYAVDMAAAGNADAGNLQTEEASIAEDATVVVDETEADIAVETMPEDISVESVEADSLESETEVPEDVSVSDVESEADTESESGDAQDVAVEEAVETETAVAETEIIAETETVETEPATDEDVFEVETEPQTQESVLETEAADEIETEAETEAEPETEIADEVVKTADGHTVYTKVVGDRVITATVPDGAFDVPVTLVAEEVTEDSTEWKALSDKTERHYADQDKTVQSMEIFDIRFVNDQWEEIEPAEGCPVTVSVKWTNPSLDYDEGMSVDIATVHGDVSSSVEDLESTFDSYEADVFSVSTSMDEFSYLIVTENALSEEVDDASVNSDDLGASVPLVQTSGVMEDGYTGVVMECNDKLPVTTGGTEYTTSVSVHGYTKVTSGTCWHNWSGSGEAVYGINNSSYDSSKYIEVKHGAVYGNQVLDYRIYPWTNKTGTTTSHGDSGHYAVFEHNSNHYGFGNIEGSWTKMIYRFYQNGTEVPFKGIIWWSDIDKTEGVNNLSRPQGYGWLPSGGAVSDHQVGYDVWRGTKSDQDVSNASHKAKAFFQNILFRIEGGDTLIHTADGQPWFSYPGGAAINIHYHLICDDDVDAAGAAILAANTPAMQAVPQLCSVRLANVPDLSAQGFELLNPKQSFPGYEGDVVSAGDYDTWGTFSPGTAGKNYWTRSTLQGAGGVVWLPPVPLWYFPWDSDFAASNPGGNGQPGNLPAQFAHTDGASTWYSATPRVEQSGYADMRQWVSSAVDTSGYSGYSQEVLDKNGYGQIHLYAEYVQNGKIKIKKKVEDKTPTGSAPGAKYSGTVQGFVFSFAGKNSKGQDDIRTGRVTDANGEILEEELYKGNWTVTETGTPDGTPVPSWWDVITSPTVVAVRAGETTELEVRNIYKTGNLTVTKNVINPSYTAYHGTGVLNPESPATGNQGGYTFRLYGTSDSGKWVDVSLTTGADGKTTFSHIPVGNYTLAETGTVDGSPVPSWWDVKMDVSNPSQSQWTRSIGVRISYNASTHAEETTNVTCTNVYKTGHLDVTKSIDDKSTTMAIADKNKSNIPVDFTFRLNGKGTSGLTYDRSIRVTGTVGSAPSIRFNDVPIGTYTLTETATIDGTGVQRWWDPYMVVSNPSASSWTKSITVNITYNDTTHAQNVTTDTVTNYYKTGNLTVHKTVEVAPSSKYNASAESRYSESLAGFGFHLYGFTTSHESNPSAYGPNKSGSVNGSSRDGKYVDMYSVTDANGNATFSHIPIGTYVVEEVSSLGRSANTGLATNTVADNGSRITQDLKRYVLNPAQIITITYDDTNHRENNHNLYFHNYLMKWKLTAHKEDFERIEDGTETTDGRNGAQHVTDLPADREATLQGAKYNLFDGNKLIATYTTDEYGYFTTDTFVCGDNWYLQEASSSEGYLVSTTKYHIFAEYDAQTIKHDNQFASPHNTYHHNSERNPAAILPPFPQTGYIAMPNGWLQSGTTMQTGEISGLPNYQSIGMKDLTKSPFYAWNSNGRANGEHWADLGGNTTSVNNNTTTVVANNQTITVQAENRDNTNAITDVQVVGNNVSSPKNAMYEPVHKASVTFLKVSDDTNEADPDYLKGAGFTYYNAETVWKKVIASPQYSNYLTRYRNGELSDLTADQLGWIKAAIDGRTFTKNAMTDDQITQCCFDCLRNDATQQYDGMRGTLPAIVYAYPNDADVTSHKLVKSFTYAGGPTVSAPQSSVVTQYIANEIFSDADGRVISPRLPYGDYLVFETTVPDVNATNRYIATTPRVIHVIDDDKDQTTYLDHRGESYKDHVLDDLPPSAVIRITKKDWTTDRVVLKNGEMYGPRYVIHDLDGAYFDLYMEDRTTAQKEQYRALFGDLVVDMAASDRGSYAHPWTSIFYNEDDGSQHAYVETPNLPHGRYEIEEVFAPLDYAQQSKEGHYRTDSSGKTFWEIEARGDEIYAKDGVITHLRTTSNDVGAPANTGYSNSPRGNFKSNRVQITISSNTIFYDSRLAKFVVDATQYNDPVIGKVSVYAEGQYLTGYTNTGSTITERIQDLAFDGYTTKQTAGSYFVENFKNAVFNYEAGPIQGSVFEIRAKEDIYSNEGYGEKGSPNSRLLFKEGDLVTTLTTDQNGKAWTKDVIHTRDHDYYGLPIGRYTITETVAGTGFALSPDNAVPRDITIEYAGQDVPIVFKDTAYFNPRQMIDLAVCKYDIETQEKISGSVFGLYADQDFKDKTGRVIIAKDTLLLMAETTEQFLDTRFEDWFRYDNELYHEGGLPLGKYYIREVNSPKGYTTTDTALHFDASYQDSQAEWISFHNTSPAPHVVSEDFAFVNEQTKLVLKVTDYDTLVELDGAKITLRNENGDAIRTEISVHDGGAVVRRLELNRTYTIDEIEPRFGYCSEIYPEQAPYQSRYARDGGYYSREDDKTYQPATDIYATKTGITTGTFIMEDVGGVQILTVRNQPVKANMELLKEGDVPTATFNTNNGHLKQVTYEFKGIPNTKYDLIAAEDIVHPDGYSPIVHATGERVMSVTTDNNGRASFHGLTIGVYDIVETKATLGYYRNSRDCTQTIDLREYYRSRVYEPSLYTDHEFTWSSTLGDELIKFQNPHITVEVKAQKLGYDNGRTYPVAGAEFTLYAHQDVKDPWGNVVIPKDTILDVQETGDDGYADFRKDLPVGVYRVQETKRPFGYYGSDAVLIYDFVTLAEDDTTAHQVIDHAIRNPITEVIVYLLDNLTDYELADAELTITDPSGNTFATIATRNTNGIGHVIKGLDPGVSYKITEVRPRFGYLDDILNKDGTHTEKDNYMHFLLPDVPVHADLSNVPDAKVIKLYNAFVTGKITITKTGDLLTDLMTSTYDNWPSTLVKYVRSYFHYYQALLTGAEFTVTALEDIYHPDGSGVIVIPEGGIAKIDVRNTNLPAVLSTVKGNLVFSGMYLGNYELKESAPRPGFQTNTTVTPFTLAYIDKDTPEVSALPSLAEYVNERQRAEIEITKIDSQNQKVLPGAVFGIYSAEDIVDLDDVTIVAKDTLLETQMTGEDGKASFISDFPLGKYYVKELWAPTGYTLSDKELDVDITWDPDKGSTIYFEEVFDDGSTDIYVEKIDSKTKEAVIGAQLAVYEKTESGDAGAQITQWTSNGMKHLVQGLVAGHAYILRELAAPIGYAKAADVSFMADGMTNGQLQTVVMEDDPIRIEIKVWEVPYEGDPVPLAGIPYGVYDSHNKLVYTVDGDKLQFVSTEDVETAEKVPVGNYTARVSSVPSGYVPPANTPIDVIDTREVQHFDIYIPVITIKITASDGETGENIPEGVVIDIIGTGGKVIKSNVPLTYLQTHYPAGTYTLKVKEVPEGYLIPSDKTIKVLVKDGLQVFDIPLYKGAPPTEPVKDVFAVSNPSVSIDGDVVQPEQTLLYKIFYTNTTGKAVDVTITDDIPEYTVYAANSADNGGSYDAFLNRVTWSNIHVENEASVTVSFMVTVDASVSGEVILNSAEVFDGKNKFRTNETHNPTPDQPVKDVFDESDPETSIDGDLVTAGQHLLYKVTYHNTMEEAVTAVITDKIPDHTGYVADSADHDGVYTLATRTLKWILSVEPDEYVTVSFVVAVDENVHGEVIENRAHVNDGHNDYDTNETKNPTGTDPRKDVFYPVRPTVSIDGKPVKRGEELLYKVFYHNSTGKEANVVISDEIPEHTKYVKESADNRGVYDEVSDTIAWTFKVPADGDQVVSFRVKVDDDNMDIIYNDAKVVEGENTYRTNQTVNPPTPVKDVFDAGDLDTSIDGESVAVGQELVYTVSHRNGTDADQQVTITDEIPRYTRYVAGSADHDGSYDSSSRRLTWVMNVPAGELVTVSFHVTVADDAAGKVVVNEAVVRQGNNTFETNVVTNPVPQPVKDVFYASEPEVSIDGNPVAIGQTLLYEVSYENTGDEDATVTITDAIPEYTTYVADSADEGGVYDADANVLTWVKDVAAGDSITVSFKVTVNEDAAGKVVVNAADVNDGKNTYRTNETHNPVPAPVKDVFFAAEPEISIDGRNVGVGDILTYTVTYKNIVGKRVNAQIADVIPEHTSYVDGSADHGGIYDAGSRTLSWAVALDDQASVTVKFNVVVEEEAAGDVLTNQADVYDGENTYRTNEVKNPVPVKDVFDPAVPDVSIDKQSVQPGASLLYKVSYQNVSGRTQTVTITDEIPAHTTYVDGSADNNGVYKDGALTWTADIADGDEWIVSFIVTVDDSAKGLTVVNQAIVMEGENVAKTNVVSNPVPVPEKDVFYASDPMTSIDGKVVKPGEELMYAVTYTNPFDEEVTAVITDAIPQYMTYVAGSADNGGTYDRKTNSLAWSVKVDPGKSVTVRFSVTVDDRAVGHTIVNEAEVDDGHNVYKTNQVKNPVSKPSKDVFSPDDPSTSIDGNTVSAGQELLYQVRYQNTSDRDVSVRIVDAIPEHTTYVDGSADMGGVYSASANEIVWSRPVAAGQELVVSFVVKVDDSAKNVVVVNAADVDDGTNRYRTNETKNPVPAPVKEVFRLSDTKTNIDGRTVSVGEELKYVVSYQNMSDKVSDVTITDTIPEFTKFVSADNGGHLSDGKVVWNAKLAAGDTLTVSFVVVVLDDAAGRLVKNKAIVRDGDTVLETNEVTNPVPKKDVFDPAQPDVSIDNKPVAVGDELLYKITYENRNGVDVTVNITDEIPRGTVYVDGSADNGGTYKDGVLTWALPVADDGSVTVSFKVTVLPEGAGTVIENTAIVDDGINRTATNTTKNPVPAPRKDVFRPSDDTVGIDGKVVGGGETLLYKIYYTNLTDSDVSVTITDAIPEHTTYVKGSASDGGVYDEAEDKIVWKMAVAPGKELVVSFEVRVADGNVNIIENTADVDDGINSYKTNTVRNYPEPLKDVFDAGDETVSIDGDIVHAGQELLYKVYYTNSTGDDAHVTITDAIPKYTTYVDGSADMGGSYKDGVLTWGVDVERDESIVVSFKVTVNSDTDGNLIENTAQIDDGVNQFTTNTTKNPPEDKKIRIQVRPVDKDTWELLPGTGMELIGPDGNVVGKWTADGWKLFEDIVPGEYVIHVTDVPKGYILPEDMKITVLDVPELQSFEIPIEHIKIQVRPVDKETGKLLPDVDMQLIDPDGNIVGKWTSEGWKLFDKIPAGEYTIRVTRVPDGYIIPPDTKIAVKSIPDLQSFEVPIEHIKIQVRPVDKDTGTLLPDVDMQLIDKNGTVVGKWTSNGWKLFEKIPAGEYTIRVTRVPDGYIIPPDTKITVKNVSGLQSFEVPIEHIKIRVRPVTEDGKLLTGVKLQLISPTGRRVGEWTSEGWKLFEKIVPGQYTIHVVSVPDGYEIPADKIITVKSIADLQSFEIVIPQKPSSELSEPVSPDGKAKGPDTGDMVNYLLILMAGMMAVLLAVLTIWKRRRMRI